MVSETAQQQKKKKPWPWPIRMLAVVGALLVALPLLVIVVPDQIVPTARPPMPSLVSLRESGSAPAGPDSNAAEALKKRLRPFRDVTALPEEKRAEAEQFNREMDELTARMIALMESSRDMPYASAVEELQTVMRAFVPVRDRHPSFLSFLSAQDSKEFWTNRDDAWNRAFMQIAVEHEEWLIVADEYRSRDYYGLFAPGLPDSTNWESAKYYFKQEGLRGRAAIAAIGCFRYCIWVKAKVGWKAPRDLGDLVHGL